MAVQLMPFFLLNSKIFIEIYIPIKLSLILAIIF